MEDGLFFLFRLLFNAAISKNGNKSIAATREGKERAVIPYIRVAHEHPCIAFRVQSHSLCAKPRDISVGFADIFETRVDFIYDVAEK